MNIYFSENENVEISQEDIIYKIDKSIEKNKFMYELVKRLADIVLALLGSIIAIPLVLIFGILIKMEDKGTVFYKQERMGKNGKKFYLYKLRSMRVDAEKYGAQWATKDDPRITKIGKIIRKTRIDELPQLINILKGEMSIIGPRPERPEFVLQFDKEIPGFINRLIVKPGLTGWAQVNGGYEMTPEEKLKWDLEYIGERNILMDINILFKTVKVVITGEGAR